MDTLQQTFDAAVKAQGDGRFDDAEAGFRAVLAQRPDEGAALFGLGLTLMGLRRFTEAVAPLAQAAAAIDAEPVRHICLAQALYLTGAFDRAANAFAIAEHKERLPDGARLTWARATAYAALDSIGAEEALQRYEDVAGALAEDLGDVAREGFAALAAFGQLDAARALGQWLQSNAPQDPIRAHELRVLTEPEVDRAPRDYVEALFDAFADRFDHQLVDMLDYRAPSMLADMVERVGARFERILDLGCGTGLAGPSLRRFAGSLTGVDLSTAMLAKAEARGGYDALIHAEAIDFLRASANGFDLIVAADVLSYFGELSEFFAKACGALAERGLLAFSVEQGESGWRLLPSARYAHGDDYVRSASAPWFEMVEHIETPLRRQATTTTPGGLYLLRKITA